MYKVNQCVQVLTSLMCFYATIYSVAEILCSRIDWDFLNVFKYLFVSNYRYIYTTSEKPVNDQSYGGVGSLRYNDTIQVKQL